MYITTLTWLFAGNNGQVNGPVCHSHNMVFLLLIIAIALTQFLLGTLHYHGHLRGIMYITLTRWFCLSWTLQVASH